MIKAEQQEIKRNSQLVALVVTWKNIKKNDECEWIEAAGAKRSVLASGELGAAECQIQGSNDKDIVGILHNDFDRELYLEIGHFGNIKEISRMIRPIVNNGDDNTNLTVSIMVIL